MRRSLVGAAAVLLISMVLAVLPVQAASAFADAAFAQQWKAGEAITPNFWGPLATARDGLQEPYKEAQGGQRLVQYFDKARMELGANGGVTNGLLASEMVKGRMQTGNDSFQNVAAPDIEMAGDPGGGAPTYAMLSTTAASLLVQTTAKIGQPMTATIIAGKVQVAESAATSQGLTLTAFDAQTGHNILRAFADYRGRVGVATVGLAISEPWLSTFNVAGTPRTVAIEVFERRVLTYNPLNTPDYQVEMGNVGKQYSQWRYGNAPIPSAPVAAAVPPAPAAVQSPPPATVPISPPNGQTWTDPGGRLTVRFPAPWQLDSSLITRAKDILGLSTPGEMEILSLSVSPMDSLSLTEHAQIAAAAADQVLSNVQSTPPKSTVIGGEPAMYVAYAGSSPGTFSINRLGSYTVVFHRGQMYEFFALGTGDDPSGFGTDVGRIIGSVVFLV